METPAKNFRNAVLNTTKGERVPYVAKGLKTLSKALNYKSRLNTFLMDDNLYFYMLLSLPFAPKNIDMLINGILCRLQNNFRFYSIFTNNVGLVFEIEQRVYLPDKNEKSKTGTFTLLKRLMTKKSGNGIYNNGLKDVMPKEFCDEVYENLESIKLCTLELCKKMWGMVHEKHDLALVSRHFDIMNLNPVRTFKVIVQSTKCSSILKEVGKLIYCFDNHSLFHIGDESIREIDEVIEKKLFEENKDNLVNDMLVDLTVHLSKDKDEEIRPLETKPTDIKDIIEEFLSIEKIPKLRSNPRLLNYFCQDPRHCLILFTFILNPDTYEISPTMKIRYKYLEKYNISRSSMPPTPMNRVMKQNPVGFKAMMDASRMFEGSQAGATTVKSKDDEAGYCIYKGIRAFQTYLLLTDNANYLYLSSENHQFTEQFFQEFMQSFKKGFHWNLTMTIKLMEYFILREPKASVKKILSLNIINFLVTMLDNSIVKNFFLQLMDPFDKYLNLHPSLRSILWKYAKNNNLFEDLIDMLISQKEDLLASEENMYRESIETKMLLEEIKKVKLSSKISSSLKFFDFKMMQKDNHSLYEERGEANFDIDRIGSIFVLSETRRLATKRPTLVDQGSFSDSKNFKKMETHNSDQREVRISEFGNKTKSTTVIPDLNSVQKNLQNQFKDSRKPSLDILDEIEEQLEDGRDRSKMNSKRGSGYELSSRLNGINSNNSKKSFRRASTILDNHKERSEDEERKDKEFLIFVNMNFEKLILNPFKKKRMEGVGRILDKVGGHMEDIISVQIPKSHSKLGSEKHLTTSTMSKFGIKKKADYKRFSKNPLIKIFEPKNISDNSYYTSYRMDEPNQIDGHLTNFSDYKLYPTNINYNVAVSSYERFATLWEHYEDIQYFNKEEKRVKNVSRMLYVLVKGAFLIDDMDRPNNDVYELWKRKKKWKRVDTYEFWKSMFANDIQNFEKIFYTYLFRTYHTHKSDFMHSSAYYCGETVNMLLKGSSKYLAVQQSNLARYKHAFFHTFMSNINIFRITFLKVFEDYQDVQHAAQVKYQSRIIKDPLGCQRLLLAETFINFTLLIDKTTKSFFREEEINCIFQILFVWFLEKRYHSIYCSKLLNFLNILVENKMSSVLVVCLIKLNFTAFIYDAFLSICVNGMLQTQLHISQLYSFVLQFVAIMEKYLSNVDPLQDRLYKHLKGSQTWKKLSEVLRIERERSEIKYVQYETVGEKKIKSKRVGANLTINPGDLMDLQVLADSRRVSQRENIKTFETLDSSIESYRSPPIMGKKVKLSPLHKEITERSDNTFFKKNTNLPFNLKTGTGFSKFSNKLHTSNER